MSSSHELGNTLSHFRDGFDVIPEQRSKRFSVPPLGMLWQERFDSIPHEQDLEINRLLRPERTVVIERRDSLFWPNEIRRAFLCYPLNKLDDRFPGCSLVPRRQRILRANNRGNGERHRESEADPLRFHPCI